MYKLDSLSSKYAVRGFYSDSVFYVVLHTKRLQALQTYKELANTLFYKDSLATTLYAKKETLLDAYKKTKATQDSLLRKAKQKIQRQKKVIAIQHENYILQQKIANRYRQKYNKARVQNFWKVAGGLAAGAASVFLITTLTQ